MNILITGASGFIGKHVVKNLQGQNYHLLLCNRRPDRLAATDSHTQQLSIDFNQMLSINDWLPLLQQIDIVINCVGIFVENSQQHFQVLHEKAPVALFRAAEQSRVKKIIQISALGADSTASSQYHLSKKAADDSLKTLTVNWVILQPSIVYGEGAISMAFFHALSSLPLIPLMDDGNQLLQPVHISDVVEAMCLSISTDEIRKTIPVVGAKAISYADLLQALRRRLGKKPAITLSLPGALLEKTAWLGKILHEPTLSRENIAMLRQGNHADTSEINHFLGHPTQDMSQQLFLKAATEAERWHAGLYLLRPLLRLSFAFLWLWSGIVSIFFYPAEKSFEFLAASHIIGDISAPVMLYGLALIDIAIGIAILVCSRLKKLILFQLTFIFLYTLTITLTLPEFWFHPFGPVLKNIPLLIILLVQLQLEGE